MFFCLRCSDSWSSDVLTGNGAHASPRLWMVLPRVGVGQRRFRVRGQNERQVQSTTKIKGASLCLYLHKTQNRMPQILDHVCLYFTSAVSSPTCPLPFLLKTSFSGSPLPPWTVTSLVASPYLVSAPTVSSTIRNCNCVGH